MRVVVSGPFLGARGASVRVGMRKSAMEWGRRLEELVWVMGGHTWYFKKEGQGVLEMSGTCERNRVDVGYG